MKKLLTVCLLALLVSQARGDATAELASFSVFDKIDLAALAQTDVQTAHGPAMSSPRYLSVQSCYLVGGPPARQVEAMRQWNPTRHSELKVLLHADIPSSPSAANFSRLASAPNNAAVQSLVTATQTLSPDLQISREEAKHFGTANAGGGGAMPGPVAAFWADLLSSRARAFSSGGSAQQPPYDHTAQAVRPADEFNGLLRQQEKIRRQFSGLIDTSGIGRGAGPLKPDLYWELLTADDQDVLTLGASYRRPGPNGTFQAAEAMYYASGGYYAGLTLYQLWPIDVGGRPSTLVWRGDFISAGSVSSLHGIERLASESAMMRDISKAITFFRRDTGATR